VSIVYGGTDLVPTSVRLGGNGVSDSLPVSGAPDGGASVGSPKKSGKK